MLWKSLKKSKPKPGQEVLVLFNGDKWAEASLSYDGKYWNYACDMSIIPIPTHYLEIDTSNRETENA